MHLLLVLLATAFAVAPCCPPGSNCCPAPLLSPPLVPQTTKVVKAADPAPLPADLLAAIVACEADKAAVTQAQAQVAAGGAALATVQAQIATAQTAATTAQVKLATDAAALAKILAALYPIPAPAPTPPSPVPQPEPTPPAGNVSILEVSRTTCGACNLMEPVLAKLKAAGYSITRVDCDVDATAQDKWKPTLLPTFIMLMDGKETNRITGMQSFDILKKWLDDTKQFKLEQGEAP